MLVFALLCDHLHHGRRYIEDTFIIKSNWDSRYSVDVAPYFNPLNVFQIKLVCNHNNLRGLKFDEILSLIEPNARLHIEAEQILYSRKGSKHDNDLQWIRPTENRLRSTSSHEEYIRATSEDWMVSPFWSRDRR